ncbi:hypothetical protein [Oceanobacillus sp. AG]|uniref:hypothetical protein n=1 Tax=Oceanobacillus sp. AG TaxID=2681969 RepID=UPI0012EC9D47|nr:hypothetical protein [Oceanobacillus sp. AG]
MGENIDVRLEPVDVSSLTVKEMEAELEGGYADYIQGNTKFAAEVFAKIHKEYKT